MDAISITKWLCATLWIEKYVYRSSAGFRKILLHPSLRTFCPCRPSYLSFVGHWRHSVARHLEWLLTLPSDLHKSIWKILTPIHSFRAMCHQKVVILHHLETPKTYRTLITIPLPNQNGIEHTPIKKAMDVPLILRTEHIQFLKGLALNRTLERYSHLRRAVFILPVNLLLPMRRLEKTVLLET